MRIHNYTKIPKIIIETIALSAGIFASYPVSIRVLPITNKIQQKVHPSNPSIVLGVCRRTALSNVVIHIDETVDHWEEVLAHELRHAFQSLFWNVVAIKKYRSKYTYANNPCEIDAHRFASQYRIK